MVQSNLSLTILKNMAEGGPFGGLHLAEGDLKNIDGSEDSKQKRTNIIFRIIDDCHTDDLRKILDSGWDVNEVLDEINIFRPGECIQWTALQVAIRQGWTEGAKLLLGAGVKHMVPHLRTVPAPLLHMALQNYVCPVDLIELLLHHGADLNPQHANLDEVPLIKAICRSSRDCSKIVRRLLENGADPNVSGQLDPEIHPGIADSCEVDRCPLAVVLNQLSRPWMEVPEEKWPLEAENAELFQTLVDFGADVNWHVEGSEPLLHQMVTKFYMNRYRTGFEVRLLQRHLDIFYRNGGNISMEYDDQGTALQYAASKGAHSNSVRWLLRRGAHIPPNMFSLLNRHFIPQHMGGSSLHLLFEHIPLILLQAGMRVSYREYVHLIDIKKQLTTWQEKFHAQGYRDDEIILEESMRNLQAKLVLEGEKYLEQLDNKLEKTIFPEYWGKQKFDLEDFSDGSLDVYPDLISDRSKDEDLTVALDQIDRVLDFLSQPQSLQWYCRRCVRENLVSLQPSVVKMLFTPAGLKRYILCHEI